MMMWQRTLANPWIGMSIGVAASALLFAACADETPVRSSGQPAAATAAQERPSTTTSGIDRPRHAAHAFGQKATPPVETAVAAAVPTEPAKEAPIAPPTAVEVAEAWKEGVALYDAGDYNGAIVPLQIAADGLPGEPYTQYLFGLTLWKTGEIDGAERALRTASELNPESIKTWINLARVRLDNDDPQGAIAAADAALALDAGSADALHQRGRALAALRRHEDALETLERAHTIDPDNGYVSNTLGYLLLQGERAGEAIPFLEAARDRLPQVAYVRNNLGVAYELNGDMARAAQEYRAAVEAGDPHGKALASLDRLLPLIDDIDGPAGDAPAAGAVAADAAATGVTDAGATANGGDEEIADADPARAALQIESSGD